MASGDKASCKACGREIIQIGGGHRQREYCDDACRQTAHRLRREEHLRQQCTAQVQTWGNFQSETCSLLAGLLYAGNEEYAQRLAGIIRNEQSQNAEPDQQNIAAYQEKLAQAAQRIEKLERQVEIQRQKLGQYYQAPSRITELERELTHYREVLDLSDRVKLQVELLALGAAVNYRRLLNGNTYIAAGQEAWCSYADGEPDETLAKAVMVARYYYTNLKELGMLS